MDSRIPQLTDSWSSDLYGIGRSCTPKSESTNLKRPSDLDRQQHIAAAPPQNPKAALAVSESDRRIDREMDVYLGERVLLGEEAVQPAAVLVQGDKGRTSIALPKILLRILPSFPICPNCSATSFKNPSEISF